MTDADTTARGRSIAPPARPAAGAELQLDHQANVLTINADWRALVALADIHLEAYPGVPGARAIVQEIVTEWVETALTELIVGYHQLQGSPEWDEDRLARLVSPEAITGVMLARVAMHAQITKAVGQRLGSRRAAALRFGIGGM